MFVSPRHCRTHRGPVFLRCDVITTHDITGLGGNMSDDRLLITAISRGAPLCCARVLSWKRFKDGNVCGLCMCVCVCIVGGGGRSFPLALLL